MSGVKVRRLSHRLSPDPKRIIARPFIPGESGPVGGRTRVERIVEHVLALSRDEAEAVLAKVRTDFGARHDDLNGVLERGFAALGKRATMPAGIAIDTRRLIGAYFTQEYAIEAAALTNPSIVPSPDQRGVPDGALRFIASLRSVGEGHISSIQFRTGLVDALGDVHLEPARRPMLGETRPAVFQKSAFLAKLREIGASEATPPPDPSAGQAEPIHAPLDLLGPHFTMEELEAVLAKLDLPTQTSDVTRLVAQTLHWLAASNYDLTFPPASDISQRVIFPAGPGESRGMEDARFVRFTEDDGEVLYYATYTAFDGFHVLPQLIETRDFATFRIATINGPAARNKGIALFPRRIGGRYAALARSDHENNYLMFSDNVRWWSDAKLLQIPTWPWELVQIGNSGAPLETEAGWLVITHGVGPMRTYALGAILLDVDEPSRVIGHLREPLLVPEGDERDGYVPNVVYSCGQLIHAGRLVVAYGASDTATQFAVVELHELLTRLVATSAIR
ncbi:MAG TPA: glycoside hydrolase family 130 protein [Candidatus Limnocylindria bacterium]|nr:glycoside hydrolase family 130 protein [Candidatus Limnocylindria bacterium]